MCLHKLNSSLYNKLLAIITSHSYDSVDSLQNQVLLVPHFLGS